MTTLITTSTTDSQMHNNNMAAGSRDRPPMLTTRRYAQWQSRFMRYVDTKPNSEALRKCILQEKEAIHLLLTGIGDKIYSTVNACKTAHDMWIAIERLQQAPKSHKLYAPPSKQSSSTRSYASTRYKGKEIAKPMTPPFESASEEDSDPEQAQSDKDMQMNLAFIAKYFKKIYKPTNKNLRTSLNSKNKNVDTSPRNFAKECKKPKRAKDYTYHKEKMLLCKQAEKAHYSSMEKIHKVLPTESGSDAKPLQKADQNAKECDDERVVLANLIANLKLDTDENKKIQKQLKKANTSLFHELQECKSAFEECKPSLGESNRTQDRYLVALHDKKSLTDLDALTELQCLYLHKLKEWPVVRRQDAFLDQDQIALRDYLHQSAPPHPIWGSNKRRLVGLFRYWRAASARSKSRVARFLRCDSNRIVMKNIMVEYFLDSRNFGSRMVVVDDTPIVIDNLGRVTFAFQNEETIARKNLSFVNLG
uniref:Integrase, catalytic region, zinc finger, CCHC-type, peptidase aspartic, catalytic n=1 Tax=Tanacetum cinerariifolium TaxID=118510 RepID=A0A6L2LBH5_TANCI|nr:hypothetical protein [Tanacetum cinerariifolium]